MGENSGFMQFLKKGLGQGRGVGGDKQGVGGTDECVCPACGAKTPHERGTPCTEVPCPDCGGMMAGTVDAEKSLASTDFVDYLRKAQAV
jgi:hypothetical protein